MNKNATEKSYEVDDSVNVLPMQEVMTFIETLCGNNFTLIDAYLALHIRSNNRVLVVMYDGELILDAPCSIDDMPVHFVRRLVANLCYDIENWETFGEKESSRCALYIAAFYGCEQAVTILQTNADVVAVFPSVKKQQQNVRVDKHTSTQKLTESTTVSCEADVNSEFVPVLVVMKAAPDFVAEGSAGIPDTIHVPGFGDVEVTLVEGYYDQYVLTAGAAVGNRKGKLGFGTLGAFARRRDLQESPLYAVTCDHVVSESQKDASIWTAAAPTMFSSPTPAWRKFALISSLGYATHSPNGNFLKNVDSLINKAVLKSNAKTIRDKTALYCSSPTQNSGDITYREIETYTHCNIDDIGSETLTVEPVDVTVGTKSVRCSGDIALIKTSFSAERATKLNIISLHNLMTALQGTSSITVGKAGAASFSIKLGTISRPAHIQTQIPAYPDFCTNKLIKNPGKLYLCQIMVIGNAFGVKGDSGSSVHLADSLQQLGSLVGFFTGTLDSGGRVFIVSPIESLTNNNYEVVSIVDTVASPHKKK